MTEAEKSKEHKPVETLDEISVLPKITEHKLNGRNYIDWSNTVLIYFLSMEMEAHLDSDPLTGDSNRIWLRDSGLKLHWR